MEILTCKSTYPFRIGTTSYIFPAGFVTNVRKLAPYLDEIELLLFESTPEVSLPTPQEIRELSEIASANTLRYNIHLPIDLYLGSGNRTTRLRSVDMLKRVIDLTSPLSPTSSTLHLIADSSGGENRNTIGRWQNRVSDSLGRLLQDGLDASSLSIETLDYPFARVEDIIARHGLSVCLDLGHLIRYGYDVEQAFQKHAERTEVIHLHGVCNGQDHLSLDKMPDACLKPILRFLRTYRNTLSIEVFSLENLVRSLRFLDKVWKESANGSLPPTT